MAVYEAGGALELDPGTTTSIPFTVPQDGFNNGRMELRLQNAGGGQNTGGATVDFWRLGSQPSDSDYLIARFGVSGGLSFHEFGFTMGSRSFRADVTPSGKRLRYEATLTTS